MSDSVAIHRFTAFLLLVLSASPFTAPFTTVSGPPLRVSERTAVTAPEDTGATRSSNENSPAFSVPSLPDGARAFLSDALAGTNGWAELTPASRLTALDVLVFTHVRAGPVSLALPPVSSISILRT